MSADAVAVVTAELRARITAVLGVDSVYVGPPIVEDVGSRSVSLALYNVVPNQALRNERHYAPPPGNGAGPLVETDALPVDLRFLVTVFREAGVGGGGDPDELLTLGGVMQALHAHPVVDVPGQLARITPEPCSVEELNRIWGLFPQASYRTSVVYLVSPVMITLDPRAAGPPVLERRTRQGVLEDAP